MPDNAHDYARSIREAIKAAVRQAQDNPANIHIPSTGQRGAVIGIINSIGGGDDNRKLLLGWLFAGEGELFDRISTKILLDEQWAALYAWCDFRKDEERVIWIPKDSFRQECLAVLTAAISDYFEVRYQERDGLPEPPDIVATAIQIGQGEITDTGVANAGVSGVDDRVFENNNPKPDINTPESPYVAASGEGRIDVQSEINNYELDKEIIKATTKRAVKELFVTKPKLYNPFD